MTEPFVLIDTHGMPHSLAEHTGGPVLAAFFKTTCPTCMLAFRYLEKLHQAYAQHGVAVWGISQDTLDDSLAFASEQAVTFPILLDTTWDVSKAYGIEFVPTFMLFDKKGQLTHQSVSFLKDNMNEMARLAAAETGSEAVTIAPAGDGNPPFKPG